MRPTPRTAGPWLEGGALYSREGRSFRCALGPPCFGRAQQHRITREQGTPCGMELHIWGALMLLGHLAPEESRPQLSPAPSAGPRSPGPSWATPAHLHLPYLLSCDLEPAGSGWELCSGCLCSGPLGLGCVTFRPRGPDAWVADCRSGALGGAGGAPEHGERPCARSAGLLVFRCGCGSGPASSVT